VTPVDVPEDHVSHVNMCFVRWCIHARLYQGKRGCVDVAVSKQRTSCLVCLARALSRGRAGWEAVRPGIDLSRPPVAAIYLRLLLRSVSSSPTRRTRTPDRRSGHTNLIRETRPGRIRSMTIRDTKSH
jgi:hypothetical protein